jgi:hypothetical protein
MKRIILGLLAAVTAVVAGAMIYDDLSGGLPGDYGGGCSYTSTLVLGDTPGPRYGIERESYWTDGEGDINTIFLDPRRPPRGCKRHIYTNLVVGELRLCLPLRPWAAGMIALVAVSALGWFFLSRSPRQHRQLDGPQPNS